MSTRWTKFLHENAHKGLSRADLSRQYRQQYPPVDKRSECAKRLEPDCKDGCKWIKQSSPYGNKGTTHRAHCRTSRTKPAVAKPPKKPRVPVASSSGSASGTAPSVLSTMASLWPFSAPATAPPAQPAAPKPRAPRAPKATVPVLRTSTTKCVGKPQAQCITEENCQWIRDSTPYGNKGIVQHAYCRKRRGTGATAPRPQVPRPQVPRPAQAAPSAPRARRALNFLPQPQDSGRFALSRSVSGDLFNRVRRLRGQRQQQQA